MKKTMLYPRKRSKKQLVLSLLLATVLIFTGAFAFLTTSETSTNLFTVGNVSITLTEPNWDAAVPNGTLENTVSTQVIPKDPTITNTGVNDAYAYIMLEVPKAYKTNIVIDGVETEVTHHELFSYVTNEGWSLIDSKVDDNEAYNYYIFAYDDALVPQGQEGEDKVSSATLFDEITFANVTSELVHPLTDEKITDLNVKVTGYAIQSDFYNSEASDPASAWELYVNQNGWLWPSNPYEGTLADLENKHKFEYYSKFSLAVTDVNNDEIGVNADVDRPDAVAGIYVEEGEAPTVVLFKDAVETDTVTATTDMNINLAGYTLNFKNAKSGFMTGNQGSTIFVDGRVSGSEISSISTGATRARCINVNYTDDVTVVGANLYAEAESGAGTAGAWAAGKLRVVDCDISSSTNNTNVIGVGCNAESANLTVDNCVINVASNSGNVNGILANRGVAAISDCDITASSESGGIHGMQFGYVYDDGTYLVMNATIENCSVTASSNSGYVYGIHACELSSLEASNCNILCSNETEYVYGSSVDQLANAKFNKCTFSVSSKSGTTYGVIAREDSQIVLDNCAITADSSYKSGENSYGCSGFDNYGTALVLNCNIKGVHSGIQNVGKLYVDEGTYQGWGHGGIYFAGTNSNAYIKNANIGQWAYDGEFDTAGMTGGNNGAAMYIGGGNNINVYMDNCTLTALRQCIVLRGTSSEQNNTLHISNSTINTHDIRIDNTTHKLYIGKGCSFDVNSVASNQSVVYETDEVYTFDMPN